ncbi:PQQ-dependent sugar dehydrogenase [Peribacillus sp. NPDC097675]|uniref:PQQ-dependent sugar dehydrogenase n=1 Tax=Peribacillus sp. NPDC097675 TaxID=3390618 RepID=UPI003D05F74F
MKRWGPLLIVIMMALTGCTVSDENDKAQPDSEKDSRETTSEGPEVVLTNLDAPWSIQKVGETLYVSERSGTIVQWKNNEMVRHKVKLEKTLSSKAEAGLLGFVLPPDFSKSHRAYAYYTYEEGGQSLNRIILLQQESDLWIEKKTLIDKIPSGDYHHGGRIKIGPDGTLYATTGDARAAMIAQDIKSLGGKVLRMNLDGTIPEDNPLDHSYIYSYGHRNPQGLAWDNMGQLYESEHGESAHDELNEILPGKNYGWPEIEGNMTKSNMEVPLIHSGNDTWAPSGIAYFDGKLFVASLRGEALKSYDIQSGKMTDLVTDYGRIRDVLVDGDFLYFISNNTDGRGKAAAGDDKLYRMPLANLQ